jgi:hypothetical protein
VDWREYNRWWQNNTDADGELLASLPEPVATLAAHVMALQGRIDRLPGPDDLTADAAASPWVTQCACSYDHPDAVCMTHEAASR